MKLSSLFKKETKNTVTVQKLEKNQLEKVIGGLDTISIDTSSTERAITESGVSVKTDKKK
jgi:hypothetical protein